MYMIQGPEDIVIEISYDKSDVHDSKKIKNTGKQH